MSDDRLSKGESLAQTVIFYLGGAKFVRNVGLKVTANKRYEFEFAFKPVRRGKPNVMQVSVGPQGDYNMKAMVFGGSWRGNVPTAQKDDVKPDDLKQTFTDLTGVETHI